jgi:protein O-mannosyl-transferase
MGNSSFNERNKIILKPIVYAVIVAIVATVLYLPILSANFVFDDISQILSDSYLHNPSHFIDVFTFSSMKKDILDNNRPVMLLSLMLDATFWKNNPLGYHLTNLLLHCLCAFLLFWVIYRILLRLYPQSSKSIGPLWAAFAAALLFAIHPVNSEAVCVVTFREDLLAAMFTLFVLFLADRFPTQKISSNLLIGAVIVICIFAAAAAKENGVVVSVLLVLYWLVVRKHTQWRPWSALIAAGLAATGLFMIARFTLVPSQSVIFVRKPSYIGGSFWAMLSIEPTMLVFQSLGIIWPQLFCADYTPNSLSFITLPVSLAVLAVLIVIVIILSRRNSGFALGMIFFILAMLPTSNLVPIYNPIADRYLYLPLAGICIALAALLCKLKMPANKWIWPVIIISAAVYIFLGFFTIQRIRVWHDNLSLWQDTTAKNPYSFIGYNNLGFAFYEIKEYDKAVMAFKRASELDSNCADTLAGLAITYDAMGQTARADDAFRKAISINKSYASYDNLMKTTLWESGLAKKLQVIADRVKQP